MSHWTSEDSARLYNVSGWGCDYFSIDADGHLQVTPDGPGAPALDLFELTETIQRRGVEAPFLLRFDGLLRARVRQLNEVFTRARQEFGYDAPYRGVYPIKVNQERWVVEALLEEGRAYGMGLEVGSKPELVAGIAMQAGEDALLVCNGYKDAAYVEMAILSAQLGITSLIVIEKLSELDTILEASDRLGLRPRLGVRVKLSFRGTGRWQNSVGDRSKFGLTAREIVSVVETLKERDMLSCLELLHFHLGSQIAQIRSLKNAMREATQVLAGLSKMGVHIRWFDAGGGLGVDYEGAMTSNESSINYSLQEYANDVVWALLEACRENELPLPTIVTESGRALAAHHSVLIAEVAGTTTLRNGAVLTDTHDDEPEVVQQLAVLTDDLDERNYLERYHDALEQREQAMLLFNTGQLSLVERARVEELFWRACEAVLALSRTLDRVPDELTHLQRDLSDTYFINASIFKSVPDSWAIGQLFPILPIHRLDEEPNRRAVLADLTCDSDGKIDRFIGQQGPAQVLELHSVRPNEPYYLGICLVGAYQEILGDMHNLFGDTNIVHVDLDGQGRPRLSHVLRGDRVKDVLSYVEYFEGDLLRNLRRHVEDALDAGRLSYEESALFWARYDASLHGYTYLTRREARPAASPSIPARSEDHERLPG